MGNIFPLLGNLVLKVKKCVLTIEKDMFPLLGKIAFTGKNMCFH